MELNNYDYILITDDNDEHYLEIGEVVDVKCYHDGDVETYTVKFKAGSKEYRGYMLEDMCRKLLFVR